MDFGFWFGSPANLMRCWLLLLVCSYGLTVIQAACFSLPNERNVALYRPVCQSSVYAERGPRLAVDGIKDPDYDGGSCTHTLYDFPAWWRVDLTESYRISVVNVVNRGDCCKERLLGAEVRIGQSEDHENNVLCGTIRDITTPSVQICCNQMVGRYVSIVIADHSEHLTLCEVEVFGVPANDKSVCE